MKETEREDEGDREGCCSWAYGDGERDGGREERETSINSNYHILV